MISADRLIRARGNERHSSSPAASAMSSVQYNITERLFRISSMTDHVNESFLEAFVLFRNFSENVIHVLWSRTFNLTFNYSFSTACMNLCVIFSPRHALESLTGYYYLRPCCTKFCSHMHVKLTRTHHVCFREARFLRLLLVWIRPWNSYATLASKMDGMSRQAEGRAATRITFGTC